MDIQAYFERIGYAGAREPTLETLRAIQLRHIESIPFENLDPLLRRPVRLDVQSLQDKLVHARRGGYCFEHNLLLKQVLDMLGFRVTGLAARVLWNLPDAVVMPRTHMLLRVDLDGIAYVVDTAFGLTPTAPLRIEPDRVQPTAHEPFRLLAADTGFVVQARLQNQWQSLYMFDLQLQHQRDYEMANWFVSTHPDSHFLHNLLVARAAPGRRMSLRNNEFTVRRLDGTSERHVLDDPAALRDALESVFGLRLPEEPALDATLARIAQSQAAPAPEAAARPVHRAPAATGSS